MTPLNEHLPDHDTDHLKSLSRTINFGYVAILTLTLLLAIFTLYGIKQSNNQINMIVDTHLKKLSYANTMRDSIRLRSISTYKMLYMTDHFERDDELFVFYRHAKHYRLARIELLKFKIETNEEQLHKRLTKITRVSQPAGRELAELMMSNISKDDLKNKVDNVLKIQGKLRETLDEFVELQKKQAQKSNHAADENYNIAIYVIILLSICILISGIVISRYVSNFVVKRGKELQKKNIQLEQANIIAESATRAKSDFLANMSHEIRTPLNGILGIAQIMNNTQMTHEQQAYTNTILNSGKLLLTVINDILDFSKIESGKLIIESIDFDLYKMINDVCQLYEANDKKINIIKKINISCPQYIVGDEIRLKQILQNLVSNALKFTLKGQVTINIESEPLENNQTRLTISVIDSGIGIDKSVQADLFQNFMQADSSTTRKFGGSGLGLAICRQLLDLMHGEIGINSKIGEGATFWFRLKMDIAAPRQSIEADNMSENNQNVCYSGQVLLVEDNLVNQMVAKAMLNFYKIEPDIAENGEIAIKMMKQKNYDLILMDCQMPIMDGYLATHKIREYEKTSHKHVAIIALTANALNEDKQKCLNAGMDDYLSKPIEQVILGQKLNRWLAA